MSNKYKYGFKTNKSPVTDNLLLEITRREWQRRAFEKTHFEYLVYKLEKLKELIKQTIDEKGLLKLSTMESLQLTYRQRAIKTVQTEIDGLTAAGGLDE